MALTKNDDFKRKVRARMSRTGESYTAARARLRPTAPTAGMTGAVLQAVADHFGLDRDDLVGRDRRPPRPEARDTASYLLVRDLGLGPADVGAALGGRSSPTVRRAVNRVLSRLEDPGTSSQLAILRAGLSPSNGGAGSDEPAPWLVTTLRDRPTGQELTDASRRVANLAMRLSDGKPVSRMLTPPLLRLREGVLRTQRIATGPGASETDREEFERSRRDYEAAIDAMGSQGDVEPAQVLAEMAQGDPALLAGAWLVCQDTLRRNPRDVVAREAMVLLSQAGEGSSPSVKLPMPSPPS